MTERAALFPVSARAVLLGLAGLVTAAAPELVAQPRLPSTIGHLLLGGAMLAAGLWRCWHPLVTISGGLLHYESRFGQKCTTLRLSEVIRVLPPARTGHGPSERDLSAQLGVETRTGGFQWIDLSELRASDRARVRRIVGGKREAAREALAVGSGRDAAALGNPGVAE